MHYAPLSSGGFEGNDQMPLIDWPEKWKIGPFSPHHSRYFLLGEGCLPCRCYQLTVLLPDGGMLRVVFSIYVTAVIGYCTIGLRDTHL